MEEITVKRYKAHDGTLFESEAMCKAYESTERNCDALIGAARMIQKFCDEQSCHDCPFCISYDDLSCKLDCKNHDISFRPWEWDV